MKNHNTLLTILIITSILLSGLGWSNVAAHSPESKKQRSILNEKPGSDRDDTQDPQQSKTGPIPPLSVLENDRIKAIDESRDIQSEVTLKVPAYSWRHGCGPTALGMVIGYYDTLGFRDLIIGSGLSQTEEVDQMIASGGEESNLNPAGNEEHYEDYAAPQEHSSTLLTDAYIAAGRTPHSDNSLADFMDTSKSTRGNYYGWSWSNDMGPAFVDYVTSRNAQYHASYNFYYNSALTWDFLTNEIDSGRPMVLLVDSDGNGSTDHFVTVIGYRTSPTPQYASWDTWSTTEIRWQNFAYIKSTVPWGIWGGWSFNIEGEVNNNLILHAKPGLTGNCSNWDEACDLQTALAEAEPGDQIWVATGTYKPVTSELDPRKATFHLKSGVAVYGGFAGTETALAERDWLTNITVLSGNIGDPDASSDNSYRVVTGVNLSQSTILDGFEIREGNADVAVPLYMGAGIALEKSSPILENLVISNNHANFYAGIYNNESSPLMRNIKLLYNIAEESGGGITNSYLSNPNMVDIVFIGNQAKTGSGGGMLNWYGNPTLTNAVFTQNSANRGGAIYNESVSSPILTNVTISNNSATTSGGGIDNWYLCEPILKNVTITNNIAPVGAGIFMTEEGCPSGFCQNNVTLTNSIVWNNSPDQIYISLHNTVNATYSDLQVGLEDPVFPGTNNIKSDPLLGALADNGGFTPTHSLNVGSPAIDVGDPNNCLRTDQRGYYRPIDGNKDGTARCDMGAYEFGSSPLSLLYLPMITR